MSLIGKSWELMAELGKRTPWGEITLQPLIDDIATVAPEFVRFLKNGGRVVVQQRVFPIWRTVVLGRHQTHDAYIASLEGKGRKIDSWARDTAANITCSLEQIELPLVEVLDKDLGFVGVYTTSEFYARAATFGLYVCPAEVGLALGDQFNDQLIDDHRFLAMEAIADSYGGLLVFIIDRNQVGLGLVTDSGFLERKWGPGDRWVLTTRKP